jgi:hypothetical protein
LTFNVTSEHTLRIKACPETSETFQTPILYHFYETSETMESSNKFKSIEESHFGLINNFNQRPYKAIINTSTTLLISSSQLLLLGEAKDETKEQEQASYWHRRS